jgi:hypothetical protein
VVFATAGDGHSERVSGRGCVGWSGVLLGIATTTTTCRNRDHMCKIGVTNMHIRVMNIYLCSNNEGRG